MKKELANGTTLTTDSDIENIKKLVLALGGAIDELNAFQNAKNGVLRQLKNPNKTKKHTGNTKIFDEGSYSTESQEKAQDEIDSVLRNNINILVALLPRKQLTTLQKQPRMLQKM